MTNGNLSNGNQHVIDLAAVRTAKDPTATTKLTTALFEAAGVSVAERPPSKDDLVPHQVMSKSEVLRQGVEAMERLSSNRSRDWAEWLKVLAALGIGRHAAMQEAGINAPRGRGYCTAFAKWLRCHEAFQAIDQADRKRMFDCLDNLGAVEQWRAGLSPAQLIKWNYPPTVLREWKRSQRPAPKPKPADGQHDDAGTRSLLAPEELRCQLELLGLARFRKEVMPEDWRDPLRDTALALASPDQLVTTLERKLSPTRA